MINENDIRRFKFYHRRRKYGRFRWVDVAKKEGISIQAVWLSLRKFNALSEQDSGYLLGHSPAKGLEYLSKRGQRSS